MIIFILAEDVYRGLQRKREIINKFLEKNPNYSINNFDLEKENAIDDFLNFLKNQSLFETKKFSILYNLFGFKNKELIKELKSVLEDKNNIILIYENKKPAKEFSFLLKKPVIFEKIEILKGKKWLDFVLNEIKKRNLNFSKQVLINISNSCEGDSFKLITELDKLSLLQRKIEISDLSIEEQLNFWDILSLLKNSNIGKRLWALEKIFSFKEPLAKAFNSLPYIYRERIENLAIYDKAIKSGKIDYDEALIDFIL